VKAHPAAEVFPLLAGAEYEALVEDIRANGLREPGKVERETGLLLDGRNRERACADAGVEFATVPVDLNGDDPVAFVVSANVRRRHLRPGSLAIAAARAWPLYEVDHGRGRERPRTGKTSERLAAVFGIGKTTIQQARALVERDPVAADAVAVGTLTLGEAYDALRARERANESDERQLERLREVEPELAERVEAATLSLAEARTLAMQREREEAEARARLRRYLGDALAHLAVEGDVGERAEFIATAVRGEEALSSSRWRQAAALATEVANRLEE
jgi:hypothetical protein